MDSSSSVMSSVHRRTPTKRRKADKKNSPVKVVYISNPMRVSASASEFMALVQELTGRDAQSPPDPSRFRDYGSNDSDSVGGAGGGGGHRTDNFETKNGGHAENDRSSSRMVMPLVEAGNHKWEGQVGSTVDDWFGPFNDVDVFTTQIMDNVSAFYESPQVDHQVFHAV